MASARAVRRRDVPCALVSLALVVLAAGNGARAVECSATHKPTVGNQQ
jgi:hypothetical protein